MTAVVGLVGCCYTGVWLNRRVAVRPHMRLHLRIFALWDGFLLTATLFYYALHAVFRYPDSGILVWLQLLFHGPAFLAMVGSIWQLTLVAWERHAALRRPVTAP